MLEDLTMIATQPVDEPAGEVVVTAAVRVSVRSHPSANSTATRAMA